MRANLPGPRHDQRFQLPSPACAQRLVNSAEVVAREMQTVGGPEILPLVAEAVRQPREAAHLHSDREVLALHIGRANLRGIGVAHDWDLLRVRDIGRPVPALAACRP